MRAVAFELLGVPNSLATSIKNSSLPVGAGVLCFFLDRVFAGTIGPECGRQ